MGKDKNGNYVPVKGRPSGEGVSKAGLKTVNSENVDRDLEIEENYTDGADSPSSNVRMNNPNRNVDKSGGDSVPYS